MVAALRAAKCGARVILLAKDPPGTNCNSAVSGGGFLMACRNLSEAEHAQMTVDTGCGINEPDLVDVLCREAPACRRWLESLLGFDLNAKNDGKGFWCPGGGANLSRKLAEVVTQEPGIEFDALGACQLLVEDGVCHGVVAVDKVGQGCQLWANATILATGGYAGLFARHDNPGTPCGHGVVLAARAGARLRDLEFVQFYPVAVEEPSLSTFMFFRPFPPEARLITEDGRDLLEEKFGDMDLNAAIGAERDELSKTIQAENVDGQVYFDVTGFDWSRKNDWFSLAYISQHDFDWAHRKAKIAPIAHHTMGGLWIDARARTTIDRLYAAGEVAAGVHGANRHGSNSMTDCLVFGSVAGREAAGVSTASRHAIQSRPHQSVEREPVDDLQAVCWENIGIVRHASGLVQAGQRLADMPASDTRLMAELLLAFAERRTESRGAHNRSDFAETTPAWQHSQSAHWSDGRLTFELVDSVEK